METAHSLTWQVLWKIRHDLLVPGSFLSCFWRSLVHPVPRTMMCICCQFSIMWLKYDIVAWAFPPDSSLIIMVYVTAYIL